MYAIRGKAEGKCLGEVCFYRDLVSVCTIRSETNAQKLQFKTKKAGNDFIKQKEFSMP